VIFLLLLTLHKSFDNSHLAVLHQPIAVGLRLVLHRIAALGMVLFARLHIVDKRVLAAFAFELLLLAARPGLKTTDCVSREQAGTLFGQPCRKSPGGT
jgi:hypothetical protein